MCSIVPIRAGMKLVSAAVRGASPFQGCGPCSSPLVADRPAPLLAGRCSWILNHVQHDGVGVRTGAGKAPGRHLPRAQFGASISSVYVLFSLLSTDIWGR